MPAGTQFCIKSFRMTKMTFYLVYLRVIIQIDKKTMQTVNHNRAAIIKYTDKNWKAK